MKNMFFSLFKIRLISIDQAVTIFGRQFTSGSAHPLVETIKEYKKNCDIDYCDTALYRYHSAFKPNNTNVALGASVGEKPLPLFQYPWGGFRLNYKGDKNQTKSRFCGPSDDDLIDKEFHETINLYNNIKNNGYKLISKKSVIGGTFMIRDNGEKKFVVLQGNHRMAVLSALGYKKVFVYTMTGYQEYIHESSLQDWSMVKNGACSSTISHEIFNAFFNENDNVKY